MRRPPFSRHVLVLVLALTAVVAIFGDVPVKTPEPGPDQATWSFEEEFAYNAEAFASECGVVVETQCEEGRCAMYTELPRDFGLWRLLTEHTGVLASILLASSQGVDWESVPCVPRVQPLNDQLEGRVVASGGAELEPGWRTGCGAIYEAGNDMTEVQRREARRWSTEFCSGFSPNTTWIWRTREEISRR